MLDTFRLYRISRSFKVNSQYMLHFESTYMLWIMVVFSSKWMFLSVSTYLIQICIWNLLKNWVVVHILKNKCSFYVTVILNNVANRSISGNSTTGGKLDSVHHSDLPIRGPRNRQYRPKSPRSHSRMDSENKSDRCTIGEQANECSTATLAFQPTSRWLSSYKSAN